MRQDKALKKRNKSKKKAIKGNLIRDLATKVWFL